jgi:transcriptional regulator with GAF, ATPase, and Fis domain
MMLFMAAGDQVRDGESERSALGSDSLSAEAFATLAVELRDSDGVEETIQAVVEFALQALSCSHAGVALAGQGTVEVPATTDPMVEEIYRWQLAGGEGPLVEAMRDHRTVLVRDTATDTRWPDWSATVLSLGVRCVLDVPLTTTGEAVGVLGLYSVAPDAFDQDDEAVAAILARHASVTVASARQEANLAQAIDARKMIGQAMGILMERYKIDGDHAFAILKRYSHDTNTKLHDAAKQVVSTRHLPDHRG